MKALLKEIIQSEMILFTIARYTIYFLLFIRGILLANYLGVASFGVYSMIILIGQYISLSSGGIQFAITVLLSKNKVHTSKIDRENLISTAVNLSILIAIFVIFPLVVVVWHYEFFQASVNEYLLFAALIGALGLVQQVWLNVFRVYHQMKHIIISELAVAVFLIAVIFFANKDNLVVYMLTAVLFASIGSVLFFFNRRQFEYSFVLSIKKAVHLFKTGLPLLFLNVGLMIITMFPQFMVGYSYGDEAMGIYSFGVMVSVAVFLAFNTIIWYLFPSLIAKLTDMNSKDKYVFVKEWSIILVCLLISLSFILMALSSIVFIVMPEYYNSYSVFNIIIISNIFLLSGFLFNSLIISEGRQTTLSLFVIIIALFVIFSSYLLAATGLDYIYLSFVTLIFSVIYFLVNVIFGWHIELSEYNLYKMRIFPMKYLVPIFLILVFSFLSFPVYGVLSGLISLLLLGKNEIINALTLLNRKYHLLKN
jgi:O-antigen/teichoic acid export membrane protein